MRTDKDLIYQELLVLRCQRGERAALEELVTAWERRLFYFIRRLGSDEQDAWVVVQFEIVYPARPWISARGVLHNQPLHPPILILQ